MIYSLGDNRAEFTSPAFWVAASATGVGLVSLAPNVSLFFSAVVRGDNSALQADPR